LRHGEAEGLVRGRAGPLSAYEHASAPDATARPFGFSLFDMSARRCTIRWFALKFDSDVRRVFLLVANGLYRESERARQQALFLKKAFYNLYDGSRGLACKRMYILDTFFFSRIRPSICITGARQFFGHTRLARFHMRIALVEINESVKVFNNSIQQALRRGARDQRAAPHAHTQSYIA